MARQRKTPFQPWQTKKDNGIEERYIRLGNSLMIAPAMLALSDKAFRIYTNMLLEAGGKKQFTYPRSKYMRISSISAFKNAKSELIEKGFIVEIQNNWNVRKANVYEFSEAWKRYEPP